MEEEEEAPPPVWAASALAIHFRSPLMAAARHPIQDDAVGKRKVSDSPRVGF